jgi:uncharacterized protein (DUF1810 family)
MQNKYKLERFIEAQNESYERALAEVSNGRKRSHWMWYIFPQASGLGFSETSRYYAVKNLDEARAYLHHPILGPRLVEICTALLELESNNAGDIFGSPDDMKLRSSMTLFAELEGTNKVFNLVLDKFFNGLKDDKTLRLLGL